MAAAEEDDDSHIIASVRRILGEDASRPGKAHADAAAPASDVFELEPGMMIEPGPGGGASKPAPTPAQAGGNVPAEDELSPDLAAWASEWGDEEPEPPVAPASAVPAQVEPASEPLSAETTSGRPAPAPAPAEAKLVETPRANTPAAVTTAAAHDEPIIEPHTAETAGHAFGSLRDTLREQRAASAAAAATPGIAMSSHAGGPTIEEMIRQELRPLLKSWLDASLPELVERMVQAEIARIVERDGA